jgi:hypothetical protein
MGSSIGSFLVEGIGADTISNDSVPLDSLLRHLAPTYNNKRILLQGPAAVSSSLIFDLAISLASNEPCRCRALGRYNCENCVAVTILRPDVDEHDNFPMLCHPLEAQNRNNEHGDTIMTNLDRRNLSQPNYVQVQSLHRVQMHHVTSIHDILHYLLTVAGRPIQQQPVGGILIDQFDHMVFQPTSSPEDAESSMIRMSQASMFIFCLF